MSTPPASRSNRPKASGRTDTPPFRQHQDSRDFLLYQIEARESAEAAPAAQTGDDELKADFKGLLRGERFLQAALEHMEVHLKFGVLAVRVDPACPQVPKDQAPTAQPPKAAERDPAPGALLSAAQALEQVCARLGAFWGRWDPTTFACFLAKADRNQCLDLAQSIRQNLALRHRGTTVSVGIALFPTINFTRQQILANAIKALDHAAFFGADSTVPFDAVTLNVSGDRRYQQNDVVGAIRELKTALMLDPSNVNVHNSLGVCYAEKKAWDLAREAFETARWLDSQDTLALYNLGLIHLLQNRGDEALGYFQKAVEIDPEMFEALVQMGRLLLQEDRASEALGYLERAAELNPESAPSQRFLGQCLERLGQAGEAIQAYRRAVKLNPQDAGCLSALGYLLDQAGENLEITTLFCKQGVELAPSEGLYRHRLGRLYLKAGRKADALAQFEKALELGHNSTVWIGKLKSQKRSPRE